jgi:hypothetical protein
MALEGSVSVDVHFINSDRDSDEWPMLVSTVIYPKGQ